MGTICELPSSVRIHASVFCCLLSLPRFTVQMILARWWAAPSFQQTQYWEFCSVQKIFIFIFSKSFSKFVKLQAGCRNCCWGDCSSQLTSQSLWWSSEDLLRSSGPAHSLSLASNLWGVLFVHNCSISQLLTLLCSWDTRRFVQIGWKPFL